MTKMLSMLLLLILTSMVAAQSSENYKAQQPTSTEQMTALLDWLEISTAARQADRLINQSLKRQTELNLEQRHRLRTQLKTAIGSDVVAASVQVYIAQHSQADWDQALQAYQSVIARRARNFEVALGLSMAADKFHQYQQQVAVSQERRHLARRLDALLHSSEIAVLLQTEIDASVDALSDKQLNNASKIQGRDFLASHIQQRRAHMATVAENLFLYAYRFFKDEELADFVDQLDNKEVRAITDTAVQAFSQVLKAGRTATLTNN